MGGGGGGSLSPLLGLLRRQRQQQQAPCRRGQDRAGQREQHTARVRARRRAAGRGDGGMGGWRAQTMSAWTRRAKMRCDAMRWARRWALERILEPPPKVLQRANGAGVRALQAARGTEDLRVPPGSARWAGGPALLVCSCPPWSALAFQVAPTRWSGGWAALAGGEARRWVGFCNGDLQIEA